MNRAIKFNLNGKPVSLNTDDSRTLLWVLRTDLDLTGTKYGCGEGICGSCTVVVNGQATRSCQTALAAIEGKNVVTVEGLEKDGKLHPLQEAFIDHGAFQCGYCTSGMLMNAYAFLQHNPKPSHAEIVDEMNNNYCRCSAYNRIVTAIADAAQMEHRLQPVSPAKAGAPSPGKAGAPSPAKAGAPSAKEGGAR